MGENDGAVFLVRRKMYRWQFATHEALPLLT